MQFNEGMLRALQKQLTKAAVTLVRTERHVTEFTQTLRQELSPAQGSELRVSELQFEPGHYPFISELYTGPVGGYFTTRRPNVATCWSPAGVRMRRHWHPDATEYIFVKSGSVVDVVNAHVIEAGESYEVAAGQVHEYFFPVDTHWVLVYSLAETDAHDAPGKEGYPGVGGDLLDDYPYAAQAPHLY